MAATLEIPLSIKNYQRVMNQLRQVQGAVNAIGGGTVSLGGGAIGGGNGGGGGGTRPAVRAPKAPPPLEKRLNTFVRSARFGAGGVSPLIGRGLDLFAPQLGALAGPVGLFAIGLTKAVQGLKDFVEAANNSSQTFNSLRYATNTTPAQAGQLQALGRAIGSDGEGLAAINGNLVNAAASGGPGLIGAEALGLTPGPSYLVNRNAEDNIRNAISRLRGMPLGQAEQYAQMAGATDLLKFRNVSPDQINSLLKSGSALGGAQGGATKAQADFSVAVANFGTAVDRMEAIFGGKLAGPAAKAVNAVTGVVGDFDSKGKGYALTELLFDKKTADARADAGLARKSPYLYAKGILGDALAAPGSGATPPEEHPAVKAVKELTRATQQHTRAVEKQTGLIRQPGSYGNATRGDAYGSGMGGLALQRMLANKSALQLSPF